METIYLSTAETAKLVRLALKSRFPAIKFGVRSKNYSGGSSMRVEWTNGPTTKAVEAVAQPFEGATFDGMIDLKTYRPDVLIEGKSYSMGADYIFCERNITADKLRPVAERIKSTFGCYTDVSFDVVENRDGSAWLETSCFEFRRDVRNELEAA